MNIVTKSVAVVLTAAALGGLGAGVASAATPTDTPAAVSQAAVGQQKLGDTQSEFQFVNGTSHYILELLGTSDPDNTNATWEGRPPAGELLSPAGGSANVDLNTTGKTAEQGTLHFYLVDKNTGKVGYFDATVAWLDNGSKLGAQIVKTGPSTWVGANPSTRRRTSRSTSAPTTCPSSTPDHHPRTRKGPDGSPSGPFAVGSVGPAGTSADRWSPTSTPAPTTRPTVRDPARRDASRVRETPPTDTGPTPRPMPRQHRPRSPP
ncbi:hypothetical protein Psed_1428 [Pseudonocardia dioxanivorans CB1190]|uniref:Uncharacterized protein n=1 Tax=Pseudonocardia dioxanivorans (strain ATCC 55486 / DSM 44775 / JCM 13855 / CB1190) TaxID=675635 RepID=F4CQW8_PSEUX|nr:hypothetical protein [Pseudonocardia dioxanivorans]AEA23667.1 hypothetical protein Psed_1428 [Pseudonocardia dioxanivorans CB1190]